MLSIDFQMTINELAALKLQKEISKNTVFCPVFLECSDSVNSAQSSGFLLFDKSPNWYTILESCWHFLIKLNIQTYIYPITYNSTPTYLPRKKKNICPQKNVYENIHSNLIHNSWNWKQAQIPIAGEWKGSRAGDDYKDNQGTLEAWPQLKIRHWSQWAQFYGFL